MKITFATIVDGQVTSTRSSGTMAYSHAVVTGDDNTARTWHLSEAAAVKEAQKVSGRVVAATPVKAAGLFVAGKSPNDEIWKPLYDAAMSYAADEMGRKRDAALAEAKIEVEQARVAADPEGVNPANVPSAFSPSVAEVDVEEPIVSVTTDGLIEPAEGLARPITKRTREAIAACAAVGLSYWSEHPKASHVWAVDADQQAHPVRIDRKRNLAIIAEPNDAIGGNPLVSWTIDADQAVLSEAATALVDAAASDQDISEQARAVVAGEVEMPVTTVDDEGHASVDAIEAAIAAGEAHAAAAVAVDVADTMKEARRQRRQRDAKAATLADKMAAADAGDPAPVAKPLTANQKKARLGSMVHDTLNKLAAEMTAADLAALEMDGAEVAAKMAAWLRYIPAEGHVVP